MKYIVIAPADGEPFPVFCCAPQSHAEMASAWRRTPASRVLSAGFFYVAACWPPSVVNVATYGRSESLNLGPRPEDARLIAAAIATTLCLNAPDSTQPCNFGSVSRHEYINS